MMQDVSARSVKELVQQSIDIATEVPEPFRVAVFSKVFDYFAAESKCSHDPSDTSVGDGPNNGRLTREDRPRKSRSPTGPKGIASQLIEVGFFDETRTVEAVAEYMSLNFARSFVSKDLSKGLIRLVQEGRLRREKIEGGKLGYKRV